MERYSVLLVDDEEEIRQGISQTIDWNSLGFELVGEAENGVEALELAERLRPDVVLTDIRMPFMDGMELCRHLKQSLPAAKLVVFSGFDDFEVARRAVGMALSDYILKPINAPELTEMLNRLREELGQEHLAQQDMETLRRQYEESLPVLQELFFVRLLDGQLRPGQIKDRAARYELELREGVWSVALINMNLASDQEEVARDELLLLSIRSFFEEQFELSGCTIRTVLYNDSVALLAQLEKEEQIYPLLKELERVCTLAHSYLELPLVTGVGRPCSTSLGLHRCAEEARSALDYRMLVRGSRVIYIGDLEPDRSNHLSFEDEDQRRLLTAVKLGTVGQVESVIQGLIDRVQTARQSLPQCRIFFMEILTSLIRLARDGGVDMDAILGTDFGKAAFFTDFRTLDELGRWMKDRCILLREQLGRRRIDSTGRTVERAKDFIARNYAESELSVESLCDYLHLSPTYFSTLFKRETGRSFITYVTDVRMERAAQLLLETNEKTYLIAEKTGYPDPNYFSYVFKRHFGITPSKYRVTRRN